jgi:hypothetical protein
MEWGILVSEVRSKISKKQGCNQRAAEAMIDELMMTLVPSVCFQKGSKNVSLYACSMQRGSLCSLA